MARDSTLRRHGMESLWKLSDYRFHYISSDIRNCAAADACQELGALAKPVVPLLIQLLANQDECVHLTAAAALKKVDPEKFQTLGIPDYNLSDEQRIIKKQEDLIQIRLEEIEVLERSIERLKTRFPAAPAEITLRAQLNRDLICSNDVYRTALESVNVTMSNRVEAVQAELVVYHEWFFKDDGLVSTNRP